MSGSAEFIQKLFRRDEIGVPKPLGEAIVDRTEAGDLGEPVEPARTWTITKSINMVPYAEARTGYRFSANGEERIVILTNATGVNMSLFKDVRR